MGERSLFLLGQELSELAGVDDPELRRFHVCGGVSEKMPDEVRRPGQPERDPWVRVECRVIRAQAAGHTPRKRVALVCDAGLGKTTNLEWLAAAMVGEPESRQIPLLLRLDDQDHLDLIEKEHTHPDALLDWLAAEVKRKAGGETSWHRQALFQLQSSGRLTLLVDGLDHGLARPPIPGMLSALSSSVQWRDCPLWVAGRPYAFDGCWHRLFAGSEWDFLRIEPLAEGEICFYMARHAGGDWYDEFPAESRGLLSIPRLLRLICGIIRKAILRARIRKSRCGSSTWAPRRMSMRGPSSRRGTGPTGTARDYWGRVWSERRPGRRVRWMTSAGAAVRSGNQLPTPLETTRAASLCSGLR